MTNDDQSPPQDTPEPTGRIPAQSGTPTPGGRTGEGGPATLLPAKEEPSSASRAPRGSRLDPAGRPAVTEQAADQRATVRRAQRRRARRMELTRRQFVRMSFWGSMGIGVSGALAAFLAFFWPRGLQGFGGPVPVAAELVPAAGDPPVRVFRGKFWLSHLRPGEGEYGGFGEVGAGGLVALWWKCPHLGCTVPWNSTFNFEGVSGWFRCPCHGSTYTTAGVRVFGPAPRPMDTMAITVNDDGSLIVDTGARTKGGEDNPTRAVPYRFGSASAGPSAGSQEETPSA